MYEYTRNLILAGEDGVVDDDNPIIILFVTVIAAVLFAVRDKLIDIITAILH